MVYSVHCILFHRLKAFPIWKAPKNLYYNIIFFASYVHFLSILPLFFVPFLFFFFSPFSSFPIFLPSFSLFSFLPFLPHLLKSFPNGLGRGGGDNELYTTLVRTTPEEHDLVSTKRTLYFLSQRPLTFSLKLSTLCTFVVLLKSD